MQNYLIVGLGNPGQKYENTRHNIGFRVTESFLQISSPGGGFRLDKKNQSRLASFNQGDKRILIAQPETFMNKSGQAIRSLLAYYEVPPQSLLVIHDDADLSFGQMKLSADIGAAGHQGVQSIIDQLGSQAFARLRFGIRPKGNIFSKIIRPKAGKLVLKKFSRGEEAKLGNLIQEAIKQIKEFIGK